MTAKELKHMARLSERKGKVTECRSSGQSVKAWCQERGIACKTYYYWEKEILSEAGRQMVAQENGSGTSFVEVLAFPGRAAVREEKPALAAKLRTGSGELEVYVGVEAMVLETLLRALKNAE